MHLLRHENLKIIYKVQFGENVITCMSYIIVCLSEYSRQIFCYFKFLGAVYAGKHRATTKYTQAYLTKFKSLPIGPEKWLSFQLFSRHHSGNFAV